METIDALKLAYKMLTHIGCVHGNNCDGNGTLNSGDQCQWCDEKTQIKTTIEINEQ